MDINQAARMIEWLDEERRRDKATIAKLEERLAQQQEYVESISRKIGGPHLVDLHTVGPHMRAVPVKIVGQSKATASMENNVQAATNKVATATLATVRCPANAAAKAAASRTLAAMPAHAVPIAANAMSAIE